MEISKSIDLTSRFDAALKERFLAFQTDIHKEMNAAREEVNRSKDLISEHTIKTIADRTLAIKNPFHSEIVPINTSSLGTETK